RLHLRDALLHVLQNRVAQRPHVGGHRRQRQRARRRDHFCTAGGSPRSAFGAPRSLGLRSPSLGTASGRSEPTHVCATAHRPASSSLIVTCICSRPFANSSTSVRAPPDLPAASRRSVHLSDASWRTTPSRVAGRSPSTSKV